MNLALLPDTCAAEPSRGRSCSHAAICMQQKHTSELYPMQLYKKTHEWSFSYHPTVLLCHKHRHLAWLTLNFLIVHNSYGASGFNQMWQRIVEESWRIQHHRARAEKATKMSLELVLVPLYKIIDLLFLILIPMHVKVPPPPFSSRYIFPQYNLTAKHKHQSNSTSKARGNQHGTSMMSRGDDVRKNVNLFHFNTH